MESWNSRELFLLTLAIGHNVVVELGAEFVLIVAQRNIHVTSQYRALDTNRPAIRA